MNLEQGDVDVPLACLKLSMRLHPLHSLINLINEKIIFNK